MLYFHVFSHFLKFHPFTIVVQTMAFQAKLSSQPMCFQSHTAWILNFPNCFNAKLQNS